MIWVVGNEFGWLQGYKELWGVEIPWGYKEGEEEIDYRALDEAGNEVDLVLEIVQCMEHGDGYARGWALWLCENPFRVEWTNLASGEKRVYLAERVILGHTIWVGGGGNGRNESNWRGNS